MILTRPAVASDRDFIVSGWSSSYRHSLNCTTPNSLYAARMHEEVDFYLARCSTLVAHGESGVLFGFIAYDPNTYATVGKRRVTINGYVLYVYVAEPFRRKFGCARALFAAAGISPTQRFGYLYQTRSSWELRSKIPLAVHEPYRARYEEIEHVQRRTEDRTAEEQRANPREEDLAAQAGRSSR